MTNGATITSKNHTFSNCSYSQSQFTRALLCIVMYVTRGEKVQSVFYGK